MKIQPFCRATITCLLFILSAPPVYCSDDNVIRIGAFRIGFSELTGAREWVPLEKSNGMLTGYPSNDSIKRISVSAPNLKRSHVILRELETQDGRRSILLTAPENLRANTQEVILHITDAQGLALFEQTNEGWEKHLPHPLDLNNEKERLLFYEGVTIFSPRHLGFYWLVDSASSFTPEVSYFTQGPSAKSLMQGSILWGFFPIIAAISFLAGAWGVSHWIHKIVRGMEK